MTKHKRPTPSTLSEWEHFPTIHDPTAQIRLARAMGYPPSWRVVRNLTRIPVPDYLAKQMILSSSSRTKSGKGGGGGGGHRNCQSCCDHR
mmetsp:Transcript_8763/g.15241  ORF Transcript_8763/g.15241 Transcript_8763/m.15241 type:complete len:90 (-) Transcript_8763:335-604(-)